MPTDTWKPVPQPPCKEPCCTGEAFTESAWPQPVVIREETGLRECGVTGCTHCKPIYSGGGDRLFYGRTTA
jgi:hypothetical protein